MVHWEIWWIYRIIAAYRNEFKHWPQIKAGDADTYQRFQNLVKLENAGHLQSWNVLDTLDIMCMLLSKLSGSARNKRSRNVFTIRRRHKRELDLTDSIHFVNDETFLSVIQSFQKTQLSNILKRNQIAEGPKFHHLLQRMMPKKSADCIYFSQDRILYRCNAFMNQTLKEKIRFLARKKIYYGCLQQWKMDIMQSHARRGFHV